jgi:hypothetical protein
MRHLNFYYFNAKVNLNGPYIDVMHNAAGQSGDHRTLVHLLAAHSRATPKQAKEPIFTSLKRWTKTMETQRL